MSTLLAGNKNGHLVVPHTTTDQGEFDEILKVGKEYYSYVYSSAVQLDYSIEQLYHV
jgi:hypothetical protein